MLLEHERYYGLAMDPLMTACSWNNNVYSGLGMDALMTVRSWNTNVNMIGAWML